jgi:carbon-monoxide dehydrogenase large subunit
VFQVNLERVRVLQGDTAEVPEGIGTFASRSMQVGGTSLHVASRRVLEEASKRAADLLGVDPGELGYARGLFAVEGSPERSVELGEVARRSGPLSASESIGLPQAFPFGAYVAVVEIDPETGDVSVLRLVAVDDCGVVVNPMLVEGQTVGSIAQGLAQSLYEGIAYDEIGQPLTANLTAYGVPTANEIPELVLGGTVTPNPNAPLGTKGAGEAGCIGTPPAIVNAIEDALWGFDTRGLDMPVTPEKVWRCLQRPREREVMPSVRGEGG